MKETMNKSIQQMLDTLRAKRGFDTESYLNAKVVAINEFFSSESLDSVVIGLSGGVDSSVALALFIEAARQKGSPIRKVVGIAMPIYSRGSTGQAHALTRACTMADIYFSEPKFDFKIADLSGTCAAYEAVTREDYDSFAVGQLLSIVRTPYLYFHAAILQSKGYRSIVSGTTNRDEGGYIGFYGKASDGMNDIQPIADIHKSEVYALAKLLGVPESIVNEKPKGDVWDGRTDFDMIGAEYDYIELHTLLKDYGQDLGVSDPEIVHAFINIERMHSINAHKYAVGLPCRFVDVMRRKVVGGWQ